MSAPTRAQLAAVAAYRNGVARKVARDPRLPETPWAPAYKPRDRTRTEIGDGVYRVGRLPTADEQATGRDDRDD